MLSKILVFSVIISFSVCQDSKINDGKPDKIEELPFVVSIQRKFQESAPGSYHWCAGSIIRLDVVLTAAHCVSWPKIDQLTNLKYTLFPPSELVILAGTAALSDDCESSKMGDYQKRDVKAVIIHPLYTPSLMIFNIALIKLNSHFIQNKAVDTAFLAMPETFENDLLWNRFNETDDCIVTGWGRLTRESPFNNSCLQSAPVSLTSTEKCEGLSKNLSTPREILSNELCTHSASPEFCWLDAGESLICQGQQVGMAIPSPKGLECLIKDKPFPGLWASIETYQEWIHVQLNEQISSHVVGMQAIDEIVASGLKIHPNLNFLILYVIWIIFTTC